MRGNDEFPFGMPVEETDEDVLVGRPTAASHKHLVLLTESLDKRQMLGLLLDLQHTVKTGVARDVHIGDAQLRQQLAAGFILHEETSETPEHITVTAAIPAEEHLVGAEDAAHAIHWHSAAFQDVQIVPPELIFDEEGPAGMHQVEKPAGIAPSVEGQIANDVCPLIVFPHLIARRREEGEQNLVFGMLLPQSLDDGAALLKLAQRGSMKPDILCARMHLVPQQAESLVLATPHLAHLVVETTGHRHTQGIDVDDDLVHGFRDLF